jgi:hypothetical protein
MSNINVKQGCPLSPTIFYLYIDEVEIYLDEMDEDSPCLFDVVIAIL